MQAFLADSARNRRAAEDNQGSEFSAEASSPSRPGESAYQHRPVPGEAKNTTMEPQVRDEAFVLCREVRFPPLRGSECTILHGKWFVSSSRRLQSTIPGKRVSTCPYVQRLSSFQSIHYRPEACSRKDLTCILQ